MGKLFSYIFAVLFISESSGFLVDKNISLATGAQITDAHYITLIDFLAEEKQARRQLEQFATQLQQEVMAVKQEVQSLKSNSNSCKVNDMLAVKNNTQLLKDSVLSIKNEHDVLVSELGEVSRNYSQLQEDYSHFQSVQHELIRNVSAFSSESANLQTELLHHNNESMEMEQEFDEFVHTQNGAQLQNVTALRDGMTSLSQQMQSARNQINSLVRNNQIRTQDFLALISENANIKSKLNVLESDSEIIKNETMNILSSVNDVSSQCNRTHIKKVANDISGLKQQVALFACGTRDTQYSGNHIVKFGVGKTAVGFIGTSKFYSSGVFIAEAKGLYLVSTTIMSHTSTARYYIFKNADQVSYVYIGDTNGSSSFTGSMVVPVTLNIGDQVYVKAGIDMEVNGRASCISITKIK